MTVLVEITGNLGQTITLKPNLNKETGKQSLVLNFSVASTSFKPEKQADGTYAKVPIGTEWLECEYWNRNADHLHKVLGKGMPVLIQGEETLDRWTRPDTGEEVRTRRVRVTNIYLRLTPRVTAIVLAPAKENTSQNSSTGTSELPDDDIPL